MSNTKRDWMKEPIPPIVGLATLDMDASDIAVVCDWAESIVRRELAGEVEKIHAELSEGDDLVSSVWKDCADCFRDDVLALLSPHQNDAEESNV